MLLCAQAVRLSHAQDERMPTPIGSTTRALLVGGFALLWLQIALGGWVSTNYAVLACTDFPTCQNSFWPAMNFREAFTVWRELGAGRDGDNISFQALTAIHYVHRLSAYVVFAAMLVVATRLYKIQALRNSALWLAQLADVCAAVTTEFENVPAPALQTLAARCTVAPGAAAVAIAQDRIAEKAHFVRCGVPLAPPCTVPGQ